eukprot:CAMPEP_0195514004 /NCGR_PEP_ID=MMETSP0794_2-20130614/5526_1 /TAXON_ID=515487 /ORGANISM="Stephanopyxis turris, Strain CCMP 815" /LENGTH=242 /DNA_ID=CAMNT_0040642155 /DNA_START=149 /DNA_END=877 /DNA_ORIENTATION=-
MVFSTGYTELLKLMIERDWNAAILRTQHKSREVKRWAKVVCDDGSQKTRVLPLHQACSLKAPTKMIETLLSIYPEAANKKESWLHRMPLHIACLEGASPEVICALVTSCRQATKVQDALGRIPLHYAMFSNATLEVIEILLSAYPEGAKVQDSKGWLAVHVGCKCNSTEEILERLLRIYPDSLILKTKGGMTPLKCAARFGVCNDATKIGLLQKTPSFYRTTISQIPFLDKSTRLLATLLLN